MAVGAVTGLTGAERRVLRLLPKHLTAPQIAAELHLSRATVRSQITSIYRKLGATSRAQAVSRARELGLLGRTREHNPGPRLSGERCSE